MEPTKKSPPKLLNTSPMEPKDEFEEKFERNFVVIEQLMAGLSDREINDKLNTYISKGTNQHDEVQLGLLYAALTDAVNAKKHYQNVALMSRDALNVVFTRLNQVIFEKWPKLLDVSKKQALWLCGEFIKNGVTGVDTVCYSLMRQIAGGDTTPANIWLTESLLNILVENRSWLDKFPALVTTVVYTYLRVAVDHNATTLTVLREAEIELCVSLLRDKWSECVTIGRDLVRLLQNVTRMSLVDKLWYDIMFNPSSLCPTFTGISQLLQTRTSRKYLISRLTPDMENKLVFLTTKVKFGQQKRYQDWFQRQYLSTAESQSLRCDLIRYICAVFHPSNELLCSDIIPRWAVIGWLLTTCTSNVAASNAKLALFYDWLFFDPERDSIMNVEPAILVMYYSMRPHPAITATLLDFMCRIMGNFCPMLASQVRQGIYTSLRSILDKRVLQNLSPLFDNPKLDRELRALIKENFSEFSSIEGDKETIEIENNIHNIGDNDSPLDAVFSDDEEENHSLPPISEILSEVPMSAPVYSAYVQVDITDHLQQLPTAICTMVEQIQSDPEPESQCETMDTLVQAVMREESGYDEEYSSILAVCLCQVLCSQFNNNLFPQHIDDETLEDSIGSPIFVMFRNLAATSEEDPHRQPLLSLLTDMYSKQPSIGYHLLYFLKVVKGNDDRMNTYRDFCKCFDGKDLRTCLMDDMRLCQDDDVRLFTFLLPDLFTQFPNLSVGNSDLLNMIVSSIDGTQLQDIICQILQGHLVMFKKDSFLSVLNASLEWETLEQYFLWQLISSHNISIDQIMPILPKLDFAAHAEALTCIMVLLKHECPTTELIRPVFCRACRKNDLFTVSILKYWAQEFEDRLAEQVHVLLTRYSSTPKKRQRPNVKKDGPSVDQVLAHLDHIRQVCRNASFLNHEQVQHALLQVQSSASDSQKSKYCDLLALADDIVDVKTTRVLRGGRKMASQTSRHPGLSTKSVDDDSDTSSRSSDEEEIKQPKSKKRRRGIPLDIDSD